MAQHDGFGVLLRDESNGAWFFGLYERNDANTNDCAAEARAKTPLEAIRLAIGKLRQTRHRPTAAKKQQPQLRLIKD